MTNDAVVRPHATQEITTRTDSREILANARRDTERYGLDDYFIVDVDSSTGTCPSPARRSAA